jgi:hypothetical protein
MGFEENSRKDAAEKETIKRLMYIYGISFEEAKKRVRGKSERKPEEGGIKASNTNYEILGLSNTASRENIRKAYKRRALETHPNKGGDPEEFKKVQRSYEKLISIKGGKRQTRRTSRRKGTRKMRR